MTRQRITIFVVVCAALLLAPLVSLVGAPYARSVAAQQDDGKVAAEIAKLTDQSKLLVTAVGGVSAQIEQVAEATDKLNTTLDKIDKHMETNLVTVLGVGEATAPPDLAEVRIGAVSQGTTASEAIAKSTAQAQTIQKALKSAGIADKDVKAAAPDISPIFDDQRKVTSYRATIVLVVSIQKPAQSAKLLDAAIKAGGSNFLGIDYKLSDEARLKRDEDARKKAFDDAKARADQYAKLIGKARSDVREVSEDFIPKETDPLDPNASKLTKKRIELKVVFELK